MKKQLKKVLVLGSKVVFVWSMKLGKCFPFINHVHGRAR